LADILVPVFVYLLFDTFKFIYILTIYIYIFYDLLCYSPMLVVFYLRSLAATTLHYLILLFRYAKHCHNGYELFFFQLRVRVLKSIMVDG
jgi:hypothetical protein